MYELDNGMNIKVKIIQVGNSLGFTLPKEALAALKVERGDTLILTQAPDGLRLTPYDPDIASQLEAIRQVLKKRRNALRELAK
jgi:putative addiction module antidote